MDWFKDEKGEATLPVELGGETYDDTEKNPFDYMESNDSPLPPVDKKAEEAEFEQEMKDYETLVQA